MPRDVRTRWNSTYDMLQFALEHEDAVKLVTSDLSNGLRKYELNDDEWLIVEELAATLKVSNICYHCHNSRVTILFIIGLSHPSMPVFHRSSNTRPSDPQGWD